MLVVSSCSFPSNNELCPGSANRAAECEEAKQRRAREGTGELVCAASNQEHPEQNLTDLDCNGMMDCPALDCDDSCKTQISS